MTPEALHKAPPQSPAKAYMKGWPDIPLILGRLRPSKRFASLQVHMHMMHGGTIQPINFSNSQDPMGGALKS